MPNVEFQLDKRTPYIFEVKSPTSPYLKFLIIPVLVFVAVVLAYIIFFADFARLEADPLSTFALLGIFLFDIMFILLFIVVKVFSDRFPFFISESSSERGIPSNYTFSIDDLSLFVFKGTEYKDEVSLSAIQSFKYTFIDGKWLVRVISEDFVYGGAFVFDKEVDIITILEEVAYVKRKTLIKVEPMEFLKGLNVPPSL